VTRCADDAPAPDAGSATGWLVGALNGFNCRLVDVTVALESSPTVCVTCELAHLRTTADVQQADQAAAEQTLVERLCKELLLQRVAVKVAHAGQRPACKSGGTVGCRILTSGGSRDARRL
jgi:hypothetical protein